MKNKEIKTYKIVKCINCKKYVISSALAYFKCSYCQKNQDIRKKKVFFESDNPLIVKEALKKIKLEIGNSDLKNQGENELEDFVSGDKLI